LWIELCQYKNPETDISMSLAVFPSISDWGRWRGDLNINLRREIISDFFFDLLLYFNYDSDPPSDTASTNDFGQVTSLGWSFKFGT